MMSPKRVTTAQDRYELLAPFEQQSDGKDLMMFGDFSPALTMSDMSTLHVAWGMP